MSAALADAEQERAGREQLRSQYVSGVIAAQEDERKRIARELHDSTSQSLTSLLIGLRALADRDGTPDVRRQVDDLRGVVRMWQCWSVPFTRVAVWSSWRQGVAVRTASATAVASAASPGW